MSSGKLWDDLGSTTFVNTKDGPEAKSFTDNAKRKELWRKIAESSDDELDFLSSGSRSDDVVTTRSKPRAKKKQPGKAGLEVVNHPNYAPKKKFPDFKKITNAGPEEGCSSTSRSKTSNTTQKASKQTKSYGILATLHDNENERLSAVSDGLSSDKDSLVDVTCSLINVSPCSDTPRRSMKGAISYRHSKLPHNKTSSYSSETNNRSTPTSCHASRVQPLDSSDSSDATPRAKHSKNQLRKFPILDPLSVSDSVVPELDGRKGKAGTTNRVPSQSHRRVLSDMTTPRKDSKSRYPFPSPLSSPAHQLSQDSATALQETSFRGSLIAAAEDADDESQKRRPHLRPFPMATCQSEATSYTPRRKISSAQLAYPDNGRNNPIPSDMEVFGDDSFFSGESSDPSSLCPFCDEKLPLNPSPFYRTLLEAARRKAYSDPRPTNSRGLKAMMGIYISSCKRHRFEAHQIPEAIAKGWPTDINFGKVRERVERLADGLAKLVRDEGSAREESVYWTIVMMEVRKLGSRAVSGVRGQFESFEKTQPGYYGELGSMILHQTLYNMFPPSSFEPQSITPLTPQEFIQRILVPEAALTLIMEDTGQDRARAVQTMRESAGYGVAMFPDTSEGPEVGAGEDIVLERARARRRELEDEERVDALLRLEDSEAEHAIQITGIKRPNLLSSATTTDIEETTTTRTTRRTMKRKKAGWRTDAESGPDDHAYRGTRDMITHKYTRAVSSGPALDPSPPQSSPPPVSPIQVGNSQRSPNRRNSSATISADDLQVIDVAGAPSSMKPRTRILADRMVQNVQGSSDDNGLGGHGDLPKLKPKPRRRIAKPKAPVDQGLGPSEPPTEQNQWRDSSVEIIEPPPNYDHPAGRENPSVTRLNDNTSSVHSRARHHPTAIRASSSSSSKHGRHDWLMNDSD